MVVVMVANHSRNDKMHTPRPMSNYLRGGCAKRWEAWINKGKQKNSLIDVALSHCTQDAIV
jgi:hypothetical protein